jgi:hypothetical protein
VRAGTSIRRCGIGFLAAVLAVGGTAVAAAGAVVPPKGDQAAIAAYNHEAVVYNHLAGAKIIESGYLYVTKGKGTSVDYGWGGKVPVDYVPATATILVRLIDGKIDSYLAELRAPGVRKLRILMASGAVYSSTTRCWAKSKPSASPFGTGESYLFNDGGTHFLPLRKSGAKATVTFTYDWVPGAHATETSSFRTVDPSGVAVAIAIKGTRSLSIHKWITPLLKAPALPVPAPPLPPVPTPICAS